MEHGRMLGYRIDKKLSCMLSLGSLAWHSIRRVAYHAPMHEGTHVLYKALYVKSCKLHVCDFIFSPLTATLAGDDALRNAV